MSLPYLTDLVLGPINLLQQFQINSGGDCNSSSLPISLPNFPCQSLGGGVTPCRILPFPVPHTALQPHPSLDHIQSADILPSRGCTSEPQGAACFISTLRDYCLLPLAGWARTNNDKTLITMMVAWHPSRRWLQGSHCLGGDVPVSSGPRG